MPDIGRKTKLVAKLVISFGILYLLFSQLDRQQALEVISRANLTPLFFALLVLVIDRVWMAWKWRMLLAVSPATISLYDAVRVYYISSFQGNALPLGGLGPDVVRYFHLRSSQMSSHTVAISIVMERIIGLLATIMVGVAAAAILISKVGYAEQTYHLVWWVLSVGIIGTIGLYLLIFNKGVQNAIYERVKNIKLISDNQSFPKIVAALRRYRSAPGLLFSNLFLSIVEQLFMVIAFYLGAVAFQIPLTVWDCLMVIPFSSLLERLPISYAGLGIREGVQVFLLGLLGIAYSDALVLSSALFFVFLVSLIPGAIWSLRRKQFETATA